MENKNLSAEPLLLLIWKNRKKFILVAILAVVISSIASFLIPIKFKAITSLLPSKMASMPIGERTLPPSGVELFGSEGEGEQMLAILNSSFIKIKLIEKFNLFKHYNIDEKGASKNDKMAAMFKERVQFERTRYGNIDIVVWDQNADTAAMIANEIPNLFDQAMGNMIRESALKNKVIMEREYNNMLEQVRFVQDTLAKLRLLGVVGEREEYATLLERQTIAMQKGGSMADDINKQIENNQKYGSVYLGYYFKLGYVQKRADVFKGNLDQLNIDTSPGMAYKYPFEYASPPDKKAYPVRWLIVAVSTIASLFFLLTLLVVLQKIKELKSMA